jgi:uncharacterized protein (TIGR02246 family)
MPRITVSVLAALIAISAASITRGQESPASSSANRGSADEEAVRQVTRSFIQQFNAGSAERVAALFVGGAELVDDAGNVHKGAAAIQDVFGRFFKRFPGATSTMQADSVRMVSSELAIEEGRRVVSTKGDQSPAATRYTLVMIKEDGRSCRLAKWTTTTRSRRTTASSRWHGLSAIGSTKVPTR